MFSHRTETKEGDRLFSTEFLGPFKPHKVAAPSYIGSSFLGQKDEMETQWFALITHRPHQGPAAQRAETPHPGLSSMIQKHVL